MLVGILKKNKVLYYTMWYFMYRASRWLLYSKKVFSVAKTFVWLRFRTCCCQGEPGTKSRNSKFQEHMTWSKNRVIQQKKDLVYLILAPYWKGCCGNYCHDQWEGGYNYNNKKSHRNTWRKLWNTQSSLKNFYIEIYYRVRRLFLYKNSGNQRKCPRASLAYACIKYIGLG